MLFLKSGGVTRIPFAILDGMHHFLVTVFCSGWVQGQQTLLACNSFASPRMSRGYITTDILAVMAVWLLSVAAFRADVLLACNDFTL
jgi:hypothetical protein